MFRYCYLLENGGLYVDVDFYCLKSVLPLLREYPDAVVLGSVRMPPVKYMVENSIPNAWMYAAKPGHPLWLVVLELAAQRMAESRVERATGPVLLREAVTLYQGLTSVVELLALLPNIGRLAELCQLEVPLRLPPVVVLPPDRLYPLGWGFPHEESVVARFRTAGEITDDLLQDVPVSPKTYAFTYWYHSWGLRSEATGRSPTAYPGLGMSTGE